MRGDVPSLITRMRRNRQDDWNRRLIAQHELTVNNLIKIQLKLRR